MRAPLIRQTKLIGENWLREGNSKNQGLDRKGVSHGDVNYQQDYRGGIFQIQSKKEVVQEKSKSDPINGGIKIIENKKRRTESGPDQHIELGIEIEGLINSAEDVEIVNSPNMQVDPKNVTEASFVNEVRLSK